MARARAARVPKPLEAPVMTMMFFILILLFFGLWGMERIEAVDITGDHQRNFHAYLL
jgi:hypothetical protein